MLLADLNYTRYAELLIVSGINLQKGDNLMIRFHPEGALLARRCAEVAYARGAAMVEMVLYDPPIIKARIDAQAGDEDALSRFPGWMSAWERTIVDERWGFLALVSYENPGSLSDCDQNALMLHEKHRANSMKRFRDAVSGHTIPWCVAGVPGPRWAKDVLGEHAGTEELWDVLRPILLLDRDDPAEAWKAKAAGLVERGQALDRLEIDSLRFVSEGTDLTVGLLPGSRWVGGGKETCGRATMANIPTEEVFTTPDCTRSDGRVRVTRPVEIRGSVVKDIDFTFRDGVLVDYRAAEGRSALESFLGTDEGARSLGEVALVGEDSPIAASGLVFGSILFDENASCHIALGSGYPDCIEGGEELTDDEKKRAAGCNPSLVHVDFMIGSPETTVTASLRSGGTVTILENGRFVL